MNKIKKFIKELDTFNLVTCAREIRKWHKTGALNKGLILKYADILEKKCNIECYAITRIIEDTVLNEVAERYVTLFEEGKL